MSLNSASVDLSNALETAREAWEDVRAGWNDPVSQHFEAEKWVPLENHTLAVLQAMDRLAPILARALRDCS